MAAPVTATGPVKNACGDLLVVDSRTVVSAAQRVPSVTDIAEGTMRRP